MKKSEGSAHPDEGAQLDGIVGAHRVAVVQHPPVFLDRAATLERATALIAEAAGNGARLIALPETFVPAYPAWTAPTVWGAGDRPRAGLERALAHELHARLVANSVDLGKDELRPLRDAARHHGVTVVCGINERDDAISGTTLYNTCVVVGPDGRLLNRHRKLVPTDAERMVWAMGDAAGLRAVDTPVGRVGGLICMENYMPLARFALYAQGVQIWVAPTWAIGDRWITMMRHIAWEGGCWVLGAGSSLHFADLPADFPGRDALFPRDEWLRDGDSVIVDPMGRVVAGPLHQEHGILYADCDLGLIVRARRLLDVAGHYGRPDVFRLEVRREAATPVAFADVGLQAGSRSVFDERAAPRAGESHQGDHSDTRPIGS